MSWPFLVLIVTVIIISGGFLDWFAPELGKKLEIDFVAQWVKLTDLKYRDVIAGVDSFFQRCITRLFGAEIISVRAYLGAALLSLAGLSAFLILKTYFLYRRGDTRSFEGAVEEGVNFTIWQFSRFATWRALIASWALTLLSLSITRYSARQTAYQMVWRQLLSLYANIVFVLYLSLIVVGIYSKRNRFPEVIFNPSEVLSLLELDYYNRELVLLFGLLGLSCALPVMLRAGFILITIVVKTLRRPVYWFLERLFRRLGETKPGPLLLIATVLGAALTLATAFLDWLAASKL